MWKKYDEGIRSETEMIKNKEINLLRGMSYVFSILSYLQDEPLCQKCKSFLNVFYSAQGKFIELEKMVNKNRDMPQESRRLLTGIYIVLADLKIPDDPVRQKKAGNCHLSHGVCFGKSALEFYERIEKINYEMEEARSNG
jgi:hypothetical protein